jgi:glutathione-independent formaldehyde dehydrogenase
VADTNQGVVYTGPGQVEVQELEFPELLLAEQDNRPLEHGVILRVVASNICGSDQHMVRGRTTAPAGQTLGHEITGEVTQTGRDVEFIRQGDLVSVPFNIACGRCRNCKAGNTGVCENVNPARAGAAYGYVDMGGWLGGQARYVTVPYADCNLLKFPDRDQAMARPWPKSKTWRCCRTSSRPATTAPTPPGSAPAPPSTSPAPARSGWPVPPRRTC